MLEREIVTYHKRLRQRAEPQRSKLELPISPASECPVGGQWHQSAQRTHGEARRGNKDELCEAERRRQRARVHPSSGSGWLWEDAAQRPRGSEAMARVSVRVRGGSQGLVVRLVGGEW